jgi:hypothetical protein
MNFPQSVSRGSPRRPRPPLKGRAVDDVPAVSIPEPLREAIEAERDNLSKAESILGCLAIAMEYGNGVDHGGPYYPDVAQIARELVRKSINGLDSVRLQERLSGHKVKEEFPLVLAAVGSPLPLHLMFKQGSQIGRVPTLARAKAARGLRLHSRNYGRSPSRIAASADSASAKICG